MTDEVGRQTGASFGLGPDGLTDSERARLREERYEELRRAGFQVVMDGDEVDIQGTVTEENKDLLARTTLIENGSLPEGWRNEDQ